MERLLLHCCCAPDATAVHRLVDEFSLALTFYNPNIHPPEEFERRRAEMDKVTRHFRLPLLETPYDVENWDRLTHPHRGGWERSERCRLCYAFRLEQTAMLAKAEGFDRFGTVLTVSPHKHAPWILEAGEKAAREVGIPFLARDLKQGGGYQETLELSRELGIWRQNYCGCRYSLWQREEEDQIREAYRERLQARLWEQLPANHVCLLVTREEEILLFPREKGWSLPMVPLHPGEKLKVALHRLATSYGFRCRDLQAQGVAEWLDRAAKIHTLIHPYHGTFAGWQGEDTGIWRALRQIDQPTTNPLSKQIILNFVRSSR